MEKKKLTNLGSIFVSMLVCRLSLTNNCHSPLEGGEIHYRKKEEKDSNDKPPSHFSSLYVEEKGVEKKKKRGQSHRLPIFFQIRYFGKR